MKYRTKIYLALVITAFVSSIIGLTAVHYQVRHMLLDSLQSNVMSIAADAAVGLNADDIREVEQQRSMDLPAYSKLQHQLRNIRDMNRRNGIFVKYIYLLAPKSESNNHFIYLVDAEEKKSVDFSPLGESADEADNAKLNLHLQQLYAPHEFIHDAWGDWMMGYAPVIDKQGNYVATVGVNLYASAVMSKLNDIIKIGIMAFALALVVAGLLGWYISKRQTKSLLILSDGVKEIGKGNFKYQININTQDEFGELATAVNTMSRGLQERERLLVSFTKYVSQHIMEKILTSDEQINLNGESRRITVLFSDIRNFTSFSEKYSPEQVVALLNEYFSVMVEVVFRNNGILDKFLGDGMMVEFGAPLDDERHEFNAVNAALEMQAEVAKLCAKWQASGRPTLEIGIGIHSGNAVIGNIGSEKRIEYTAIGDTVNVASRIESLNKELKTKILISEATVAVIKERFNFIDAGEHVIRGRQEKIHLYTIE